MNMNKIIDLILNIECTLLLYNELWTNMFGRVFFSLSLLSLFECMMKMNLFCPSITSSKRAE